MSGAASSRWVGVALVAAGLLVAAPGEALACGYCTRSIVDALLPGVNAWSTWAVAWLAAMSLVRYSTKVVLPFVPLNPGWLVLGLGFLGCGVTYGLLPLLPLALGPLVSTLMAFIPGAGRRWGSAALRGVRWVGLVGVATGVVLAGYSTYVHRTRSDVDFMCEWPGGPVTRGKVKRLAREEPASLATYREILRRPSHSFTADVAERVAEIGDPAIDLPLLRDALSRYPKDWTWDADRMQKALEAFEFRASVSSSPAPP